VPPIARPRCKPGPCWLAIMNTAYPWPNADTAGVSSSTLSLHCSRVFYIHYQSIHALLVIWTALPRSMHNLTWTAETTTCDRRSQSRICLWSIVLSYSEHGMFMFGTTGCAAPAIDRHSRCIGMPSSTRKCSRRLIAVLVDRTTTHASLDLATRIVDPIYN
jgi:hypothetical protein